MNSYKLLTPGPLTTTRSIKEQMLFDHCTWDEEYKAITQKIRRELLSIAHLNEEKYTAVLMQGSGTFGVESTLMSAIGENQKALICTNGAYGERIVTIAQKNHISHVVYSESYDQIILEEQVARQLKLSPDITHVVMVHCETTTGILNDIESIGRLCREHGKTFIVDAMSSFGGIPIPVQSWNIDFIISSANKCIQGVPGFSFVIANRKKLEQCKNKAKSLSLDLYDQWQEMEKSNGKWRFTSPTHTVLAFSKALDELKAEGGVLARYQRYRRNNTLLIQSLQELGFETYVSADHQSPIITTFLLEDKPFTFIELYDYVKNRGYAIYPGKLTEKDTFRMGNIGEIYEEDILKLKEIFTDFLKETIYDKSSNF